MGYDTDYFEEEVSEELKCSICNGVLESPVITPCDHLFCSWCIGIWIPIHQTCPIDRLPLRRCMLKSAPRVIRNMINQLRMKCQYDGCKEYFPVEIVQQHLNECKFNPSYTVQCTMYCGRDMTRSELANHNCVNEMALELELLRIKHEESNERIANLTLIVYFLISIIVAIVIYFKIF